MRLLTPAGARETPERGEAGATHPAGLVAGYDAGAFFDEMIDGAQVERGLTQRIRARNHFLGDAYGARGSWWTR